MAVAIPDAFGEPGAPLRRLVRRDPGRAAHVPHPRAADRGTIERERAGRILTWFAAAAVFWLAGAFAEGEGRAVLWLIALAIDYSAPLVTTGCPAGRVSRRDAGTSRRRTSRSGSSSSSSSRSARPSSSPARRRPSSTSTSRDSSRSRSRSSRPRRFWWLYFDYVAVIAERRLELSADRTRLARDGYTYLHAVMVAGIIVSRGRRRARDRAPARRAADGRARRRGGRARALPPRARLLPAAPRGVGQPEAPRGGGRVRRGGIRRARRARARRLGTHPRRPRSGDRRRSALPSGAEAPGESLLRSSGSRPRCAAPGGLAA